MMGGGVETGQNQYDNLVELNRGSLAIYMIRRHASLKRGRDIGG